MSFSVGTVEATIGANTKPFMSGLKSVRQAGVRLGSKISSIGRTMSMSLSAPIAGAGILAIKTASDYERLRVSMDTLNGSVREGARNFQRLKEFSARTPFQLQDLAKAQNMLQGFGQSADDAFESISMIGDIAAITGADINGIGIAFGQAAAEGRLMTRDIRQLINQGVPAIKLLADTMGVAQSEVLDLASQGEISFEILQQAFRDATSEGGMFADGMEKQSKTISGLFSTLRDNVSLALGELGDEIVKTLNLKELIPQIISGVKTITNNFKALSDESRTNILKLAGLLGVGGPIFLAVGALVTAISTLSLPVLGLIAAIGGIGFAFKSALDQTGSFSGAMQLILDKLLNHTISVFQDMLNVMDWANLGVFDSAISAMEDLKRNVDETADFTPLADATNFIIDTFSSLKTLFGGLTNMASTTNTELNELDKNIKNIAISSFNLASESATNWDNFKVKINETFDPLEGFKRRMVNLANAEMIAMDIANQFTQSFGQGISNVIVQGERLLDVLKNMGRLLLSSAIQKGLSILLTGGLGGAGFFGSGGGLFGNLFKNISIGDGMITSDGSVVKMHPNDKMFAMKDGRTPNMGGGGMSQSGMEKALEKTFRKFIRSVPDRKIFEMAEQGRYR